MCDICDGKTYTEVMTALHDRVEANRFTVMAVQGSPSGGPPWAYTIGLADHGRPELIVAGMCPTHVQRILDRLGRRMLDDWDDGPPGYTLVDGELFRLVAVHPSYWEGDLFAAWKAYHDRFGPGVAPSAVEVVPGSGSPTFAVPPEPFEAVRARHPTARAGRTPTTSAQATRTLPTAVTPRARARKRRRRRDR